MEENGSDTARRRFVSKLAGVAVLGSIAGLISAQRIGNVGAEGQNVQVGGEYTDAASRTLIEGDVGTDGVIETRHTALSGATFGVYARSDSIDGIGLYGYVSNSNGSTKGVKGRSDSIDGTGVYGLATNISGLTCGVYGESNSDSGWGVHGYATAGSGFALGVLGESDSTNGRAVCGYAYAPTGSAYGVWGISHSVGGRGVSGYAGASTGSTYGVYGESISNSGRGVRGRATAFTGSTYGVFGSSDSESGRGVFGYAAASTGSTYGVYGLSDSSSGISVLGQAGNVGAKPLVAMGASSQLANLQEWQNNDGTALSVVDKDGKIGIGTSSPSFMLHIISGVTGPLTAASAPGAGPAPNSFIVENLTSGNFKSQFTFRASGVNKYSFGNDMGGIGQQNFFIWDEVAAQAVMYIDSGRKVGLGTLSPEQKLHVAGRVKATGYDTGDIKFANGFTVTENEELGLAFKNDAGDKIAVLDRQGNLHIKGDLIKDL